MKPSRFSTAAQFTAPLLFALALPADEIQFHPKAASEATKKLTLELELKLDEFALSVNGEEMPPDAMGGMQEQSLLVNLMIGVTDKYVETKEGKPTELLRTFDEVKLSAEAGEQKNDVHELEEIVGKTVRFKWNEDSQAYDRTFHESKGEDEELENLLADMDVMALLPEKKVSAGDTWEVSGEHLASVFLPGGLMGKSSKGDNDETFQEVQDALKAELEPALKDFKIQCKYKGSRDEGGVRVNEIAFTFDGQAKLDVSELMKKISEIQSGGQAPETDVDAKVSLELKGEGTLLWDGAAGRMQAFDMQAEISASADISATVDQGGQSMEFKMTAASSGKATWAMKAEKK